MSASIVTGSDSPEPFLPGRVPLLQEQSIMVTIAGTKIFTYKTMQPEKYVNFINNYRGCQNHDNNYLCMGCLDKIRVGFQNIKVVWKMIINEKQMII